MVLMTEKRYFKREWEEEFYIFDSNTISESDFEEKLEYQGYKAFEDSMMGDEVVNRLNKYNKEYLDCYNDVLRLEKENEKLKRQIGNLEHTRDFCADVLADYERIEKENRELKKQIEDLSK